MKRWSIKTGTDPAARLINVNEILGTTLASLTGIPAPTPLPDSTRIPPVEMKVYRVSATLLQYRKTEDSDYHLVIRDPDGKTMIVELPALQCVTENSPWRTQIASVRARFDSRFPTTTSFLTVSVPVQIVGVGFWDEIHGQLGVAPNGIELHPVLDLAFADTMPTSIVALPQRDYSDLWWNSGESGWGMSIIQHDAVIFAVWYTYDEQGSAHWYVLPEGTWRDERSYTGNLYETRGPPFSTSFDAQSVTVSRVGTMTIQFEAANTGTLTFEINGVTGSKAIERQPF